MVSRCVGVMYRLEDIMIDKIPHFLILRGVEGILVFLREFLKRLNVFHGSMAGVLCDDIIEENGIVVEHDMIGVDWNRMHCRYSAKNTVCDRDIDVGVGDGGI